MMDASVATSGQNGMKASKVKAHVALPTTGWLTNRCIRLLRMERKDTPSVK